MNTAELRRPASVVIRNRNERYHLERLLQFTYGPAVKVGVAKCPGRNHCHAVKD